MRGVHLALAFRVWAGALLGAVGAAAPAWAEGVLPRFASLRHDAVHVRAGPGQEYPIRWTYQRQGLPVVILRNYENWRFVRDPEGDEGWVHASGLTRRRTVLVTGGVRVLRAEPSERARAVARLEAGVVARLDKCERAWCRVSVQGHAGWLRQQDMWGVKAGERLD
jgi:SH3-like domain-containing protein